MSREVKPLLKRDMQLNAIAYFTILALACICAMLVYMIITQTPLPTYWIFGDSWVRGIGFALVVAVVVYLADQQRRLHRKLRASYSQLAEARSELQHAYERLVFAYHAAEIMAAQPDENGLVELLDDVAGHFGAHAAAVVGDNTTLFVREERFRDAANAAVCEAALDTVRAGNARTTARSADGSMALAVPLRVNGKLTSVLCVWRHRGSLSEENIEGMRLVARILELSMENHALLVQTGGQLGGMVHALLDLLERRCPQYSEHADLVSRLSDTLAQRMGVGSEQRHSLRLAGLLHDVGLLEIPEQMMRSHANPSVPELLVYENHPAFGADLASVAGLDDEVQGAILGHHERYDGSGFPRGLVGDETPLLARILAVADDFSGITTPEPGQPPLPEAQALHIMRLGAGTMYDPCVVSVLLQLAEQTSGEISAPPTFDPEALLVAVE